MQIGMLLSFYNLRRWKMCFASVRYRIQHSWDIFSVKQMCWQIPFTKKTDPVKANKSSVICVTATRRRPNSSQNWLNLKTGGDCGTSSCLLSSSSRGNYVFGLCFILVLTENRLRIQTTSLSKYVFPLCLCFSTPAKHVPTNVFQVLVEFTPWSFHKVASGVTGIWGMGWGNGGEENSRWVLREFSWTIGKSWVVIQSSDISWIIS